MGCVQYSSMTASSDDFRHLGDYRLIQLLSETPQTQCWLAEQISVGRKVLVDELRPELLDQRPAFLAEARAKAAMRHPLVASVYEAVSEDGHCFYAHEFLPGKPLSARAEARAAMKPAELAQILRKVAEVQQHYEQQQQSSAPIGLENIRIDEHGIVRIENLARDGARGADEAIRDMDYLGRAILPLVADGQSGATRLLTLLSWMRGEELEQHLGWHDMMELCEKIEKQLTDPLMTNPLVQTDGSGAAGGQKPVALIAILAVLALAVIVMVAIRMRPDGKGSHGKRVPLPEPVSVTPGGGSSVQPFRMAAHEVTIEQYSQFLNVLQTLAANDDPESTASPQHKVFDHRDQPATKDSHVPDDWDALLAAARSGKPWNGKRVGLDSPVVGVDWWDAAAYAEWKRARLPSYEEWLLALGVAPEQIGTIMPADWEPVDPQTPDRSGHGVLNMCGSVSEWLLDPMASPTNPLGDKKWVVIGGSYQQPGSHALTREWVDDRSLRRDDVGFRLVFPAQ